MFFTFEDDCTPDLPKSDTDGIFNLDVLHSMVSRNCQVQKKSEKKTFQHGRQDWATSLGNKEKDPLY